jgi:TctA family transporter
MDAERKNRMSSNLVRLSGLAAMLGGVLGIILTPILTYLWATNSDVYGYFGRAYFLVFLGRIAGLVALYTLRRRNPGWQATEKLGEETLIIGMTFVGLVMGLVGDILEYWGGSPSEGFA